MGIVTGAGADLPAFESALWQGVGVWQHGSPQVARVEGIEGNERAVTLLLLACQQAVEGVAAWRHVEPNRRALVVGTTCGNLSALEKGLPWRQCTFSEGTRRAAQLLGVEGPVLTVTQACASGASALWVAAQLLKEGLADQVIAGGYDDVPEMVLHGFRSLHILGEPPYRVLDTRRNGLIPGEGAAALVLSRGDPNSADDVVLVGGWSGSEGGALTQPTSGPLGLGRSVRQALTLAGIGPGEVDHVNLHASGTRSGDEQELATLRQIFGDHLSQMSITATKPLVGHLSGAASAVEVITTVLSLKWGWVPPVIGLEELDPRLGSLRFGSRHPTTGGFRGIQSPPPLRTALKVSAGFGGNHAALIFRRASPPAVEPAPRLSRQVGLVAVASRDFPPGTSAEEILSQMEVPPGRDRRRIDAFSAGLVGLAAEVLGHFHTRADGAGLGQLVISGLGNLATAAGYVDTLRQGRVNPAEFPLTAAGAALGMLSTFTAAAGPALQVTAEGTGWALALGLSWLRRGHCQRLLVVWGEHPGQLAPEMGSEFGALLLEAEPQPGSIFVQGPRLRTKKSPNSQGDGGACLPNLVAAARLMGQIDSRRSQPRSVVAIEGGTELEFVLTPHVGVT